MSTQYRDTQDESYISAEDARIMQDAQEEVTYASIRANAAWARVGAVIPDFYLKAVRGLIDESENAYFWNDPMGYASGVEQLALYIELTGCVPADPEIFFDFGNP